MVIYNAQIYNLIDIQRLIFLFDYLEPENNFQLCFDRSCCFGVILYCVIWFLNFRQHLKLLPLNIFLFKKVF